MFSQVSYSCNLTKHESSPLGTREIIPLLWSLWRAIEGDEHHETDGQNDAKNNKTETAERLEHHFFLQCDQRPAS